MTLVTIFGARNVGKTTLFNRMTGNTDPATLTGTHVLYDHSTMQTFKLKISDRQ